MFPEAILNRLANCKVVAGFSVDHIDDAVPLANALLAGGIDVIELTLRTEAGIDATRAISTEVPEILVGVGTILAPEQAVQVKEAGAHFGVSPGLNPRVIKAAKAVELPFAPGIATPSDIEAAIELDCRFVKYFPAAALGGVAYLRSMSAPYAHLGIQYFRMGGLNAANMNEYLAEPNVPAIGGSWIVQKDLVKNKDWAAITTRAQEVVLHANGS